MRAFWHPGLVAAFLRIVNLGLILLVVGCTSARGQLEHSGVSRLKLRVRQPTALVVTSVGGRERLLVANRKSRSISLIDTISREVVVEHDVGLEPVDLVALPGGQGFLAVDEAANALVLLHLRGESLKVSGRVRVSGDPVRVSSSRDGKTCVVASRWTRRLTFLELGDVPDREPLPPRITQAVELPFYPRELLRSGDDANLVVADAFGGNLALLDLKTRSLKRILKLPAHNIRGLAMSPDGQTLLVAHQVLGPLARTVFDDVHWGDLVGNQLHVLPWSAILHGNTEYPKGSHGLEIGDVGRGAADPSGLIVDRRGRVIVALGGVNELAIFSQEGERPRRVAVGRRPMAMVPSSDENLMYVADALDDTISVVAIDEGRRLASISLGPRPEPSLTERGEQLFHDAGLSHDGWMSCQSCHSDGHTSGLLADTLGDGSFGAPKKIPSLFGVGSTGPWNWTGSMDRLEDQVRKSIMATMQGSRNAATESNVAALTAYLRSLKPVSPSLATEISPDSQAATRGRGVFEARRCGDCHVPPAYTSPDLFDVGLSDEVGNRRFNPPSLRGVSLREPLLHDGRAGTLNDLFVRHKHPKGELLAPEAIADLVAFLKTL
jgi:cytochrome c peroxidase